MLAVYMNCRYLSLVLLVFVFYTYNADYYVAKITVSTIRSGFSGEIFIYKRIISWPIKLIKSLNRSRTAFVDK